MAFIGGRGGKSKQEFWFLDTTSGISTPVHGENESNETTQGWSIVGEGASRSVKPTTIIFANTLLVAEAAYAYLETHPGNGAPKVLSNSLLSISYRVTTFKSWNSA